MPLSHTQDVAGPLARTIEDLAIVLDLIAYPPIATMPVLIVENQPGNNCSLNTVIQQPTQAL